MIVWMNRAVLSDIEQQDLQDLSERYVAVTAERPHAWTPRVVTTEALCREFPEAGPMITRGELCLEITPDDAPVRGQQTKDDRRR